jgi:hypothetical protein
MQTGYLGPKYPEKYSWADTIIHVCRKYMHIVLKNYVFKH